MGDLWASPGGSLYDFCSQLILWNLNIWPTLTELRTGKPSLAVGPGRSGNICRRSLPELSSTSQPGEKVEMRNSWSVPHHAQNTKHSVALLY